jgi:Putative prokaryotic signal transducing protein
MVRIASVDDPARVSYLSAMLKAENIEVTVQDRSLGSPYTPSTSYELYVAEEDGERARRLLRQLEADPSQG